MKTSWQTSLAGAFVVLGGALALAPVAPWLQHVGQGVSLLGTAGIGFFARDNNKTSEQVGAGNVPPEKT